MSALYLLHPIGLKGGLFSLRLGRLKECNNILWIKICHLQGIENFGRVYSDGSRQER